MLEDGMEHLINLKVFDAMDGQQYRWTCAPSADAMFSAEAKCPFEVRPLTLNPQLMIADQDFSPAGSKFELNLNMVRQNTNIIQKCSVFVQKKFKETAQEPKTFIVSQEEEVADPTRKNTMVCALETPMD